MKRCLIVTACILGMVLGAGNTAVSAENTAPAGKFYGKIYADWYYDFGDTSPAKKAITKHSEFELSRVYLGYNYKINDRFTVDALLDVGRIDPATGVNASFDTTKKIVSVSLTRDDRYFAFLKTAYLSCKNMIPYTTLSIGQIPYFAFNVQEKFWGHRYIYQSFLDKQGWESSADLGAAVNFAPIDIFRFNFAVTNGEGYKASQDTYGNYKIGGSVQFNLLKALTLYVYSDWMPVGSTTDNPQSTVAAFIGYSILDAAKIGLEYNTQFQQKGIKDHNVNGLSIYGMYNIIKTLEIFARFDMKTSKNDWNTKQDGQTIISGLQYSPVSKVKIAANYQRTLGKPSGSVSSDRVYLNCEFDY